VFLDKAILIEVSPHLGHSKTSGSFFLTIFTTLLLRLPIFSTLKLSISKLILDGKGLLILFNLGFRGTLDKEKIVFRNRDIKRVLIGVPENHKHLRIIIESEDKIFVFHEATIANIVRGFILVKTHPEIKAIEMKVQEVKMRKEGFAEYQLIETNKKEKDVINEVNKLI